MAVIRAFYASLVFDIASPYNCGLLKDKGIQLEIGPKTLVKNYMLSLKK